MSLQSFTIQRYRAFRERTKVELRPITLLFGYNSAGKSALLRMLPLLRDSLVEGRDPFHLGSDAIRGASFPDLLSRLHPTPVLSVELVSQDVATKYEIRYLPDQRRQVIERISRSQEGIERTLQWTTIGSRYELWIEQKLVGELEVDLKGLSLSGNKELLGRPSWEVPGAEDLESVQWVDALRARVGRRIPFGARPSDSLAADGRDAPAIFAYAKLDESPVYETVRDFYREHLGHEISVVERTDDFKIVMTPIKPLSSRSISLTQEKVWVRCFRLPSPWRRPPMQTNLPSLPSSNRSYTSIPGFTNNLPDGSVGW